MTSHLSHSLHRDTVTNFTSFFPSEQGVHKASSNSNTQNYTDRQAAAAPSNDIMQSWRQTHIFAFILASASVFFSWIVALDPADILNYSGMPKEAQVPGNLTPGALPSSRWGFNVQQLGL